MSVPSISGPDSRAYKASLISPKAATRMQEHLDIIQKWKQDWRVKVKDTKSTQVIYALRRSDCPHVYLNNIEIPRANVAKYFRTASRQ